MLAGIKLIITYCRFIGNTFFGWTYHGERISKWKIIFYKIWNICLLVVLVGEFLHAFEITSGFNKSYKLRYTHANHTSSKIDLFDLLFLTSSLTFNFQGLLNAIYLFFFGSKLMTLLIKQEPIRIDLVWEQNLAKLVILVQNIYPIFAILLHTFAIFLFNRTFSFFVLLPPIYLSTSNQIFVLSIIIYKTMVIRKELVNFCESNMEQIYKLVLNVDQSIRDLDRYLSMPLLFTLLANQIYCIANLCQVALGSHIFEGLCIFIHGFLNLIVICYISNIIPSTLANLLDQYEQKNKNNKIIIQDKILMMQLRQLNERIGFTVFGLFRITGNTFITCLGLIITYSVIIIQTGNQ